MIDWTTPIKDNTKISKIWKARGNESAQGGCYICGSQSNTNEYAFGHLHIDTIEQHITADLRLGATKRYSYAPPVRRCLCDECIRWEYSHHIGKQGFAVFLFFGILSLIFGLSFAVIKGFSDGIGMTALIVILFLAAVGFLSAALWELRPRKTITADIGDVALTVIYTGISSNDIRNCGYYIRSESGKAPNDPLRRSI